MKQQPWKSGNVQPQARLTDDLIDTTIYFVQRIRRVFFVREAVSRVVNEVFVEPVMAFCVLSTSYVFGLSLLGLSKLPRAWHGHLDVQSLYKNKIKNVSKAS